MGWKGLTRDIIMAYVAFALLTNRTDNFTLAMILIVTVIFFTIFGFYRFLKGR